MKSVIIILLAALGTPAVFAQQNNTASNNTSGLQMKKTFWGTTLLHDGRPVKPKEVLRILEPDAEALRLFKKAKSNYDASIVLGAIGGFCIGYPVGVAIAGGDAPWAMAGVGAAFVVVSIPLDHAFKKHTAASFAQFNNAPAARAPHVNLVPRGNGLSVVVTF